MPATKCSVWTTQPSSQPLNPWLFQGSIHRLNLHEQVPTQQLTTLFFSLPFSSQCKEKLGEQLPPHYALELLTVYAWECRNGVTEFSTAQGFRTVLELTTRYKELQVHWTVFYDFQDQEISTYLLSRLTRAR